MIESLRRSSDGCNDGGGPERAIKGVALADSQTGWEEHPLSSGCGSDSYTAPPEGEGGNLHD
jgi:hypothetical protein